MKKFEASKIILCALYCLMFLIIGFSMVMTFYTKNLTLMIYIIIGVFILCSSATGFYYWKAKAENMEKIRNQRIKSGNKKVDMSDIASIQDNLPGAMSGAFGGSILDGGVTLLSNTDSETSEYEEEIE